MRKKIIWHFSSHVLFFFKEKLECDRVQMPAAYIWPEAETCQRYQQNRVDPPRCLILRSALPSIPGLIGSGGSEPRAFQPGAALNWGWNTLNLRSSKSILQIIKNKQYTVFMRRKERKDLFNLGHFVALISQLKGEPCWVTHFCLCEVCRQSRWPLLGLA